MGMSEVRSRRRRNRVILVFIILTLFSLLSIGLLLHVVSTAHSQHYPSPSELTVTIFEGINPTIEYLIAKTQTAAPILNTQ